MARFSGRIGFVKTVQGTGDSIGIWTPTTIEKPYYGDVIRNTRRWKENGDSTNDDLTISNQISIVANSFAIENIGYMKYVTYLGLKWKIEDVSVEYPRLVLTLGGQYNG